MMVITGDMAMAPWRRKFRGCLPIEADRMAEKSGFAASRKGWQSKGDVPRYFLVIYGEYPLVN